MKYLNTSSTTAGLYVVLMLTTGIAFSNTDDNEFEIKNNGQFPIEKSHQTVLEKDMRRMADSVRTLFFLSTEDAMSDKRRRRSIVDELVVLESVMLAIRDKGELYIGKVPSPYLENFLLDVAKAREKAEQSPPDFKPAGDLIGSCLGCHNNIGGSEY